MDLLILVGVCVAGLLAATWMAIRWCHLERIDDDGDAYPTGWVGTRRALRSLAIAANAAAIAGILVGGFGGRLFMRIMAATSDDSVQGRLTDAEEKVGEITFGGSMFLIIFAGLFAGLIGVVVYRVIRRWLPRRAWLAGIIVGLTTLGLMGNASNFLDPNNPDFKLLSPSLLAVAMVTALALGFGVVLVSVHERLERGMPDLTGWSIGLLAFVPLIVIGITPLTGPAIIAVAVVASFAAPFVGWWRSSRVVASAGRYVVGAGVVGAAAYVVNDIATILA